MGHDESPDTDLSPSPGHAVGDARRVVTYLTTRDSDEYIALMDVLDASVTDLSPAEVTEQLRAAGTVLAQETVEARLEQLCEWGAVSGRADTSQVQRYADLLARNRRYTATTMGRRTHRFYLHTLASAVAVREIPLPSLQQAVSALEALAAACASATPLESRAGELASHIGLLFTSHDALDQALVGAEDNLAELADRFDLDDTATADLKSILVDYATHVAAELDRGSARAAKALAALDGHTPALVAVAVQNSRARDLIASGALEASRGGREEDWAGLRAWFAPQTGRAARFGLRLTQALPGMHANLRRLHTATGSATTRARALAFARACHTSPKATEIWQAALGDHSWRKLAGVAEDEEGVRASTTWAEGPGVAIPELLRSTGRTGTRGRAAVARDDTAVRHLLAERRRERQRLRAEAAALVLAAPAEEPLPERAARLAYEALTAATRGTVRRNPSGVNLPGRTGTVDSLACTLLYLDRGPGAGQARALVGQRLIGPTWQVLTPGRVAIFHAPGRRPQIPSNLEAILAPDPGGRVDLELAQGVA